MTKSSTRYTIGTTTVGSVDATSSEVKTVIIKNNYSENIQVTIFFKNGNEYEVVFSNKTIPMSVPAGLTINSVSIQSNKGGQMFNASQYEKLFATDTLIFNVDENFQISAF